MEWWGNVRAFTRETESTVPPLFSCGGLPGSSQDTFVVGMERREVTYLTEFKAQFVKKG